MSQALLDVLDPTLFPVHLAFVFVFGSLWGSFFGLCIARIPAGQSIVFPNSYCFACGQTIRWYDNIPLLSYWFLRGRCRDCGTTFGLRHFMIELLSGLLFAAVFYMHGYTPMILVYWIFTGLLIIATFTDIDHWIIPDSISLGGTVIGILLALIPFPHDNSNIVFAAGPFPLHEDAWWTPAANAVVGAAFGYAVMWLIGKIGSWAFKKEAMGGGDIKLMACFGAFLGFTNCFYVLFLASVLGVIFGVSLILCDRLTSRTSQTCPTGPTGKVERTAAELSQRALAALYPDADVDDVNAFSRERSTLISIFSPRPQKRAMRHHLPFGPYLAAAALLVMLFHERISEWISVYMNLFQEF